MSQSTLLPEKTTATPVAKPHWPDLHGLRREIERVIESLHAGGFRPPFSRGTADLDALFDGGIWGLAPAVDVRENDGGFEITVELPGMEDRDVEVRMSGDTLTLRGEKRESKEDRASGRYRSERRFGSFVRTFQLPHSVDEAGITASFEKGLLTISLPKTTASREGEKTIPVKAA